MRPALPLPFSEARRMVGLRFTLVELLVVIAVIVLLAGLLLPALKNSVEQARKVACENNQKNIGLGVFSHCNDYNGYIPLAAGTWNGVDCAWRALMADQPVNAKYAGTYMDSKLWECPSDTTRKPGPTPYPGFDACEEAGYGHYSYTHENKAVPGYLWAAELGWWKTTGWVYDWCPARRIHQLRFPATDHIFTDGEAHINSNGYFYKAVYTSDLLQSSPNGYAHWRRHHGCINMYYADGHVSALNASQFAEWRSNNGGRDY